MAAEAAAAEAVVVAVVHIRRIPMTGAPLPVRQVIIETTGLADPAPVAQTFFVDDDIQAKYSLDGIITVADSKHILARLDDEKPEGVENEAVEQARARGHAHARARPTRQTRDKRTLALARWRQRYRTAARALSFTPCARPRRLSVAGRLRRSHPAQ